MNLTPQEIASNIKENWSIFIQREEGPRPHAAGLHLCLWLVALH